MADGICGTHALRMAETTLRANGGFTVRLRMPGQAIAGQDGEQLGLRTPVFQDAPLFPAVWRKVGVNSVLLLPAAPVLALVGHGGFASAEAMFEAAAGVVVEDLLYTISGSEPIVSGGDDVGYRLNVVKPMWS